MIINNNYYDYDNNDVFVTCSSTFSHGWFTFALTSFVSSSCRVPIWSSLWGSTSLPPAWRWSQLPTAA